MPDIFSLMEVMLRGGAVPLPAVQRLVASDVLTPRTFICLFLILGAIFFGIAALIDAFSRRESEARMLLRALANLQVGLICLAGALAVLVPTGWLLLLGALILASGVIWLGYGLYLMFW